jgi:hypothetical protein
MTVELTEKAKENLRRNEESRKKDTKFVKLEPGEKTTLHFDPEKIEPVEVEFEGKKSIRYQYTVTDPNEPEKPKYFTVSKRITLLIDTILTRRQKPTENSKNWGRQGYSISYKSCISQSFSPLFFYLFSCSYDTLALVTALSKFMTK